MALTIDEILSVIEKITYKPGSSITLQRDDLGAFYLLFNLTEPDVMTGQPITVCDHEYLNPHLKEEEQLLDLIQNKLYGLAKHEVDEWLKVAGQNLKEPHPSG